MSGANFLIISPVIPSGPGDPKGTLHKMRKVSSYETLMAQLSWESSFCSEENESNLTLLESEVEVT